MQKKQKNIIFKGKLQLTCKLSKVLSNENEIAIV